jgi:hypothetical protein
LENINEEAAMFSDGVEGRQVIFCGNFQGFPPLGHSDQKQWLFRLLTSNFFLLQCFRLKSSMASAQFSSWSLPNLQFPHFFHIYLNLNLFISFCQ